MSIAVRLLRRPRGDQSPFLTPLTPRTFETRRSAMRLATQVGIATALVLCLPLPASAVVPKSPAEQSERIETLAHARFGPLSAAELAVVRSAPRRELAWVGP